MSDSKVLILTTAHDSEDGRLIRHRYALERNNISTEILSLKSKNRAARFVIGPVKAYLKIKEMQPNCVILPDPELQLFLPFFLRKSAAVISDVHEAYELVVGDRAWIRGWFRPIVIFFLRVLARTRNRWSFAVLIADKSIETKEGIYVSNRPNPLDLQVVRNSERLDSLVYVGDIRKSRGLEEMVELVKITPGISLDLIGPCNNETYLLNMIAGQGLTERIRWHGRLPYRESWEIASTAIAGLCFLQPTPAFQTAISTKIWEYWAVGIPVLGSKLDSQSKLIEESGGGFVGEVKELTSIVQMLALDPDLAHEIGQKGHNFYRTHDDGSEERLIQTVSLAIGR